VRFATPLVAGRLERRYKRFLADVMLDDGRTVTAHVANSGSMLGLARPGACVLLRPAGGPGRKLDWSWELVEHQGALVAVNTGLANAIVADAIAAGGVPELAGYPTLRREVKYGEKSRVDILLEAPDRPACYVEVKSVTLCRQPGLAEFPDAVTARGARHLAELAAMVAAGRRSVLVYLVMRGDCQRFSVAADIDPAYAQAMAQATAAGLEVLVLACRVDAGAIEVDHRF
jgi:sugar fermentation stimulation protein A